jgi:hypothetical protein
VKLEAKVEEPQPEQQQHATLQSVFLYEKQIPAEFGWQGEEEDGCSLYRDITGLRDLSLPRASCADHPADFVSSTRARAKCRSNQCRSTTRPLSKVRARPVLVTQNPVASCARTVQTTQNIQKKPRAAAFPAREGKRRRPRFLQGALYARPKLFTGLEAAGGR